MMKKTILALNNISKLAEEKLKADYEFTMQSDRPDAIIVRSFNMHDYALPETVLAVSRAGAGTNNIPVDEYAKRGVVVFNTPGANANAVKELVIAALLMSGRKIVDGIEWVKTLKGSEGLSKAVESGKKAFVGREISEKTLGIIGLGAIGILVANAAISLGMNVVGVDPYLSTANALRLNPAVRIAPSTDALLEASDFVTIHVPYNESTKYTVNSGNIGKMKKGAALINLARGELVENAAVLAAIKSGALSRYVTDFPADELIGTDGVIVMPHLGASTPEAEDNCAAMAARELVDYIENGNVTHSVNFPDVSAPRAAAARLCIMHENAEGVINAITSVISGEGINIANLLDKSKKDKAYMILDLDSKPSDTAVKAIEGLKGIIRVRLLA